MAYNAGSVIVDIVARASSIRQAFGEARSAVSDFGAQVNSANTGVRGLGQSIISSLAEPKSVFNWANRLGDTLNNVNYVAGRGFVQTGRTMQQMATDVTSAMARVTSASAKAAEAGTSLANSILNSQRASQTAQIDSIAEGIRNKEGIIATANQQILAADQNLSNARMNLQTATSARESAEMTRNATAKKAMVESAQKDLAVANTRSESASDKAYLATLRDMQVGSAASRMARDQATEKLRLAQANVQAAESALRLASASTGSTGRGTGTDNASVRSAVEAENAARAKLALAQANQLSAQRALEDANAQNVDTTSLSANAQASLANATADEANARARLNQALGARTEAEAELAQAQAAGQSTSATNASSAASNANAAARNNQANGARRAQMADLDLIFAAMYAQQMMMGLISVLGGVIEKGLAARNAIMGLESVVRSSGQSVERSKEIFASFKKDGLLSNTDISTSMKNLLLVGYSLDQASTLIDRFKDSAAFGKQASLEFGTAIVRTTEGIRLGLSTLSDGAGMAKNLSQILKENGYAAEDLSRVTTDLGVRTALFNGILKETAYSVGDAAKLSKDLGGTFAMLKTAGNELCVSVLTAMSGLLNTIALALIPIIMGIKQWIDEHPKLTTIIITATIAVLALATVMLSYKFLFPMMLKGLKELFTVFTLITSPIGLVITAIVVLGIIFAANSEIIMSACKDLYNVWSTYFSNMWNYLVDFASNVGDILSGIGTTIMGVLTLDTTKIQSGLDKLVTGFKGAGTAIVASSKLTTDGIIASMDIIKNKLDPGTLLTNTYNKISGFLDPVTVDLSDKPVIPRQEDDGLGKKKKKKGAGKAEETPYSIAKREYQEEIADQELLAADKLAIYHQYLDDVEKTSKETTDYIRGLGKLELQARKEDLEIQKLLLDKQIAEGKANNEDALKLKIKLLQLEVGLTDENTAARIQAEIKVIEAQNELREMQMEHKRALLDKEIAEGKAKNEVALERDIALLKEKVLATEAGSTKRIKAETDVVKAEKALSVFRREIAKEEEDRNKASALAEISLQEQKLAMMKDYYQVSQEEYDRILIENEDKRYRIELQSLERKKLLCEDDKKESAKVETEITALKASHVSKRNKLEQDQYKSQHSMQIAMLNGFRTGMSTILNGLLQWNMTIKTMFRELGKAILSSVAETWIKGVVDRMSTGVAKMLGLKATEGASEIAAETTKQTSITAVHTAGESARALVTKTAVIAATVSSATAATSMVTATSTAFIATLAMITAMAAAIAPILPAGPALAAAMVTGVATATGVLTTATATATGALTALTVPSLDVGAWSIDRDKLAMVHEGETVIPKRPAQQFRDFVEGNDLSKKLGGSGGGDIYHISVPVSLTAMDTHGAEVILKKNGDVIGKIVEKQIRNFKVRVK